MTRQFYANKPDEKWLTDVTEFKWFQYTGRAFYRKRQQAGMAQSMSRVAHCIDNGPMEGLWGISA